MSTKEKKMDRHSNTGMRGAPKKGGAGGKGTWGVGGKDDLRPASNNDPDDPNYDSEGEEVVDGEQVVLSKVIVAKPSEVIIKEYISGGDIEETVKTLQEVNLADSDLFVKDCLLFGIEHHAYERELISQLLSALYGQAVSGAKIEDGFQRVVDRIDDISLDNPDAVDTLSKFLARAVVDEIVAPAFLKNAHDNANKKAKEVLSLANGMITERHRIDRLAHVWGPGDLRSVRRLREETATLLQEYLDTGDLAEADKCVRNRIDAPSFYFQIVKQAVRLAFARHHSPSPSHSGDSVTPKIVKLLTFFSQEGLFSPGVIEKGLSQIYERLEDERLDNPQAPAILAHILEEGQRAGWISKNYQPPAPAPAPAPASTTSTSTSTSAEKGSSS
jgi:hypothetical protein